MSKKNCVIIPIYKETLGDMVIKYLNHNLSMLSEDWEPFFIAPKKLEVSFYENRYPNIKIRKFEQWNGTVEEYNILLWSENFYLSFQKYEYLLIMHTDALVLKSFDELKVYTDKKWGYIGAPWLIEDGGFVRYKHIRKGMKKSKLIRMSCRPRICSVGNGGLCLRNIRKTVELIRKFGKYRKKWFYNEDIFFSYFGQDIKGYLPPVEIAKEFALETGMRENMKQGIIPFGVHKWEEWYPDLIEDYKELFNDMN